MFIPLLPLAVYIIKPSQFITEETALPDLVEEGWEKPHIVTLSEREDLLCGEKVKYDNQLPIVTIHKDRLQYKALTVCGKQRRLTSRLA